MQNYLELRQISKYFGDFVANDAIDLTVAKGSIHAIIGENGAGKSTLMNVLSGIYRPDGGSILIEGKAVRFANPTAAARAGIGMVHQEFMLYPELTVLENIIMGYEVTSAPGIISRKRSRKAVEDICKSYSFNVPLDEKTGAQPVAMLQQIEIVKVLYHGAEIIIFDEPTRGIDVGSKYEIYKLINELAEQGVAIIMISSEMPEVLGMSDRIMVMYEGRVTGEIGISEANQEVLMHMASNTYERYKQELIEQEEK